MKSCSSCKQVKPLIEFYRHPACRDGYRGECKACTYDKHKSYRAVKGRTETPEQNRRYNLKRQFNISPEDYDEILSLQNGVCAICGSTCKTGRRLAVDHCHMTGRIRGLLCSECNNGIGKLKDSPDLLRAAISYLED